MPVSDTLHKNLTHVIYAIQPVQLKVPNPLAVHIHAPPRGPFEQVISVLSVAGVFLAAGAAIWLARLTKELIQATRELKQAQYDSTQELTEESKKAREAQEKSTDRIVEESKATRKAQAEAETHHWIEAQASQSFQQILNDNQLAELRAGREAQESIFRRQTKAHVICYLARQPNRSDYTNIIIKNVGHSVAKDIHFAFEDISDLLKNYPSDGREKLKKGIAYLPPGEKLSFSWIAPTSYGITRF